MQWANRMTADLIEITEEEIVSAAKLLKNKKKLWSRLDIIKGNKRHWSTGSRAAKKTHQYVRKHRTTSRVKEVEDNSVTQKG